jgi:hypothetical protein
MGCPEGVKQLGDVRARVIREFRPIGIGLAVATPAIAKLKSLCH